MVPEGASTTVHGTAEGAELDRTEDRCVVGATVLCIAMVHLIVALVLSICDTAVASSGNPLGLGAGLALIPVGHLAFARVRISPPSGPSPPLPWARRSGSRWESSSIAISLQRCLAMKRGLEGLVDPSSGEHPVTRVWRRAEIYNGYDPDLIPDLRAGNNLNYRVSWQTTLGGVPQDIVEDNLRAWSGDHCSNDPALVPGILFVSRKLASTHPHIMDVMPTVLKLLEIERPAEVDGQPLF